MADDPLFEFAVPDDLLREAVSQVKDPDVVAELEVMPGTGEGKPPSLIGILNVSGYAPLILLTAAALVPGTFGNGINLIGANLKASFHMSNASLGAVAFIAQVSQLLWAVPLAVWADRGSRKVVAGVSLLIFAGFGSLMAISPNVWAFAFLYLAASVGTGVNNTVHNSYLSDAYPTEGRGRIFSWHNLSDPLSQTVGILIFGFVVTIAHDWRYGLLVALAGIPLGLALFTLREPEKGANESSHILKASGMDLHSQQEQAPRVLLGSAVTRLLRIRSLYYELVAVAILGFAGTGAPLFGNLFFIDKFHLDTASRSEVYAIIGLAAFLGLPIAYVFGDRYFRKSPQRPLVIAGVCITAYGGLFVLSLYVPQLWMCRDPAVPLHRRRLAARHLHLPHAGRHGAAGDAHHLLRDVRGVLAGVRRIHRLGAARRVLRCHRRPARHHRFAHLDLPGLCRRWAAADHRLALRAPRHHAGD